MPLISASSKVLLRNEDALWRLMFRLLLVSRIIDWTVQIWHYAAKTPGERHVWHVTFTDLLFGPIYFLPRILAGFRYTILCLSDLKRASTRLRRLLRSNTPRTHVNVHTSMPLDSTDRQIRLLHLQPRKEGDIRITTSIVSLHDRPVYTALSYVCGDTTVKHKVVVDDAEVGVSENLFQVLSHLCDNNRTWTQNPFWIDALSINQQNLQEHSHQVRFMKSIYWHARKVLVWLGPPSQDSELALAKMRALEALFYIGTQREVKRDLLILKDTKSDYYTTFPVDDSAVFHNEPWQAVRRMLENPWWSRAWIAQEVSSPTTLVSPTGNVEIILGRQSQTISLRSTLLLIAFLTQLMNSSATTNKSDLAGTLSSQLQEVAWGVSRFTAIGNIRKRGSLVASIINFFVHPSASARESNVWATKVWNMLRLFRSLQATDPRDKIFCSLPLVLPSGHPAFQPDYTLSLEKVYVDVVKNFLTYQGLNILSACTSAPSELPSFVPDWRLPPKRRELCVWTGSHQVPCYQASGTTLPEAVVGTENSSHNFKPELNSSTTLADPGLTMRRTLSIRGIDLDKITFLSPIHTNPRSFRRQSWESILLSSKIPSHYLPTDESLTCAYQRTLTADIHSETGFELNSPSATILQKAQFLLESLEHQLTQWLTQARKYERSYSVYTKLMDGIGTSHTVHQRGAPVDPELDMLSPWRTDGSEPEIPSSMYNHLVSTSEAPCLSDTERLTFAEADYRELLAEATWGRVLCVTEKGYIGLVPDTSEIGDEVVLFMGAGTPFVVRQIQEGCVDDGQHDNDARESMYSKPKEMMEHEQDRRRWKLIGDAYIHGLMDGQAIRNRKRGRKGKLEGSKVFVLI